ncbi:MAG: cytochrome c biogenesis protein CcsA, partial [Candidatus Omnitrophica bacterium]|nr:cytochrome c biogenesis protein CcsA [Candidatus Omnitrophota bacterium]
ARNPERFGVRWGQAHVLFLEPATEDQLTQWLGDAGSSDPPRGTVVVHLPGRAQPYEIPVPERLGEPIALESSPYVLTFKQYFADLAITEDGVISRSDQPDNPAIALTLSGPEGTDAHLLFGLHPEFPALHGRTQVIPGRVSFRHPAAVALPPHAIAIIRRPDASLSAVLTGAHGERQIVEAVAPKERHTHPSLGYEMEITDHYPRARRTQQFVNRGDAIRAEALHVMVQEGKAAAQAWVGLRDSAQLPLGAHPITVEYRPARRALPFTIKLLDFRKIDYPGTQMAAGFESDVELTDPQRGIILLRQISMNNPLRYRGFSFYQSSFIPGPPETTVLSVRSDPGTPFVYAGFLIVIGGVIAMFVLRKWLGMASLLVVCLGFSAVASADPSDIPAPPVVSSQHLEAVRQLAVQHSGRLQPFDSFARESLWLITGASQLGRQDPVATVLAIAADPSAWAGAKIIAVPYGPLREQLGVDARATHVSYNELVETKRLMRMLPGIVSKQQRDEKLTVLENEAVDVYSRFVAVTALMRQDVRLVPPSTAASREWLPVLETSLKNSWEVVIAAFSRGDAQLVQATAGQFAKDAHRANPSSYPPSWRLRLEVLYNRLAPFRIAGWLYVLAFLALLCGVVQPAWRTAQMGHGMVWAAFLLHATGIAARVVLGGRPPVSNFFETMLWLPFVMVAVALIFERIYRAHYFALAASALAAVTLHLAYQLPLDPSIAPVVAVLRSNLWLTIHVLTIVASYGALTLAMGLAHVYGWLHLVRSGQHPALATLDTLLYRAIQVGVVLLAGGIMLGAVWANASWGRYWGWDPKETWALITLLWFLAILHGRFAGWIHGVGVALATIGGFFLLLMTYYGVSFYLDGLHSYAGGHAKPLPPLLIAYLIAECAFLALVGLRALSHRRPA